MAVFARHNRVQSYQWKARQVVIEVNFLAPTRLFMALPAIAAHLALVRIILAMARDARHRQLVAVEVARVAALACDLRVTAAQWKLGCLVVVEGDRGPCLRGMARLATSAVFTGVFVLQAVAGMAGRGQAFVALTDVARCAGDVAVRAGQRETGLAVVEGLDLTPDLLGVAALA